jgi:uncharacterized membrane protein
MNQSGRKQQPDIPVTDTVSGNIDVVAEIYAREERKISLPRTLIEKASEFVGRPVYLAFLIVFVSLWMIFGFLARQAGWVQFDPPPFHWLQGFIGLLGLFVGTAVLIRQDRLARMAEQHAQLDLQVNLLTEQKTTKIIQLLEELRRDLPTVANRHDEAVMEMQRPTDPHAVLGAINTKRNDTEEGT